MGRAMHVDEIMTIGCEAIDEHDSISTAARIMREKDLGALAICGAGRKLKGLLTDRDIVTEVIGKELDPAEVEAGMLGRSAVVVHADDDVELAIDLMARHQIRRLPVVDVNDKLVGMVSQGDIAIHLDSARSGRMLARISEPR